MGLQALFFYIFATVAIASALMVISAKNPVHSVLFLILTFFNAAGLFLLTGAEFLAMILLVVYVGAVAVLFLFVVMMLDVDFAELRSGVMRYAPIGLLVGIVLAVELVVYVGGTAISDTAKSATSLPIPALTERTNTAALGDVLYSNYIYFFQLSGLVLLVAMIGAIVLTLRERRFVKRQKWSDQLSTEAEAVVELRQVETGKGAL